MDDKWSSDRKAQVDKVQESELAVQKDNKCRMDDAMEHVKRSVYLQSFRDENKRVNANFLHLCITAKNDLAFIYQM